MKEELLVNSDFRDFLEILNKHQTDYCIVGAFAVGFYAEPRYTQDIDIYVSNKPVNAIRVAEAVK
jgi:predicted nucleotidyltransferase